MKDTNKVSSGYYHSEECNLADFQKIIDQKLTIESVPKAKEIKKNIPIKPTKPISSIDTLVFVNLIAKTPWPTTDKTIRK